MKRSCLILPLILISFLYSCASTGYNTQKGAAVGAALGAIAGQAIGRNTKSTLEGAVAGTVLGAVVGNAIDQYETERRIGEIRDRAGQNCPPRIYEDCPPGRWMEVPGRWVGGKWVPRHRVWVPVDP